MIRFIIIAALLLFMGSCAVPRYSGTYQRSTGPTVYEKYKAKQLQREATRYYQYQNNHKTK